MLNIRLSNALVCSQFPRRPIPQPLGSERWQADTGASASITNDRSNMFNVREVNPNEEFVQIGDKGLMPVVAIGSVLLRFVFLREGDDREHKVETQVDNVLVVPGMGFNLFSGWRVSVNGQAVSLQPEGTHIMNGKLIFMRGPTSDYSYAIRLPPPQTDTIVQHEIANVSFASSVPLPPAPCAPAEGLPRRGRPGLFRWICTYVCVRLGSESGPSQSPSVLSVTAQRAGAGVSGLHHGRGGLPRSRGFSCMCTTWLPVVPVVGAAPLCFCLVPRSHRMRCDGLVC